MQAETGRQLYPKAARAPADVLEITHTAILVTLETVWQAASSRTVWNPAQPKCQILVSLREVKFLT